MRRLFSVIQASVLSGVVLVSAGVASAGWEDDRDRATACYDAVLRDPSYSLLTQRLAVDSDPTIAQLSNENVPTEGEVGVLRAGVERTRPCRALMLNAYRMHHPYMVGAVELRYFQNDLVYVQLFQRRISYGNAARLLHQAWLELKVRRDAYNQARSDEQRRALAESMDNISRQARSAPPLPSGAGRMTCRWVGPTLYCDPY